MNKLLRKRLTAYVDRITNIYNRVYAEWAGSTFAGTGFTGPTGIGHDETPAGMIKYIRNRIAQIRTMRAEIKEFTDQRWGAALEQLENTIDKVDNGEDVDPETIGEIIESPAQSN